MTLESKNKGVNSTYFLTPVKLKAVVPVVVVVVVVVLLILYFGYVR